MSGKYPYCWFKNNIETLAAFLDEQLVAPDVKEVVILGDLFDQWIIPADATPLDSYQDICSNPANKKVIDGFRALAGSPDVKLSYVPGNHDMSMDLADIPATKDFLATTFPGMRFFCNNNVPLGAYSVGALAAEHGDRYCLFNAPDTWTAKDTFLPLGYFISRLVAYKFATQGMQEDYRDILETFLKDFMKHPDFIEDLLAAVAKDAGLTPASTIDLQGIPGFDSATMTVGEIGKRFRDLTKNWERTPGNVNVATAIIGDVGNLSFAASLAYLSHMHSNANIVVFGHTHTATMISTPEDILGSVPDENGIVPSRSIYANSGAWVDSAKAGCTYVESEEVAEQKRHYVRVKRYAKDVKQRKTLFKGYVGM